jgi:glycosyltransferase involved in cell wall biosynthesis
MKIGIDARWIFPEISGIGTYTRELVRHLVLLDRVNEYELFFDNPRIAEQTAEAAQFSEAANFRVRLLPYGPFAPRGQLRMPALLRDLKLDVFHSPNYMMPLLAFGTQKPSRRAPKSIVTIHDLIPLLFPEHTPKALKVRFLPVFRWIMRQVGARADLILTVSESSRQDVLKELRIPPARRESVIAVPNGVAPEFKPLPKRPLGYRTILYVGRFDPYKNVLGLLETFQKVCGRVKENVRLRIVGSPDPRYPEAAARARELGIDGKIEWAGYVGGADLVRAYQQADVFVLQSKYEGFGLTVLEAMACGTPVVCSRRSSIPEVAGNAALLVDPDSTHEVADALVRVLSDPRLAADLREKGIGQAAKFTWVRTAAMTMKAYEHAVKG